MMPEGRQTNNPKGSGSGREFRLAYHGGKEAVPAPEIRERFNAPDFGRGFYTTESEEQAVKEFDGVSEEWFDAVIACRGGNDVLAGFDVVVGPVANDNIYQTLRFFETGVYSKEEAMRRLLAERLFNQVVFKTPGSLRALRYVSHAVVSAEGGAT